MIYSSFITMGNRRIPFGCTGGHPFIRDYGHGSFPILLRSVEIL